MSQKLPNVIYLQIHGVDKSELTQAELDAPINFATGEITWCVDKIFDTDVKYVLPKKRRKRRVSQS